MSLSRVIYQLNRLGGYMSRQMSPQGQRCMLNNFYCLKKYKIIKRIAVGLKNENNHLL